MADRAARIAAFLAAAGWSDIQCAPLAADASFRRYYRLEDGDRRAVLMDAAPPREDVRPFLAMARHLTALGYSAPRVFADDVETGLLLLEDLGDDTFTRLLARGEPEDALYTLATDLLIDLHRRPVGKAVPAALPPYDDDRFVEEAALLTDWYMPQIFGEPVSPAIVQEYRDLWGMALGQARDVPEVLVLRDYHVDNLTRVVGREGIAACGLLDFQDAVRGPCTYDLVSLVEDARRDISAAVARASRQRYLAAFPGLDRAAFDRSMAILGAQRHAKVIGIFTRLCIRDSKPGYLHHIPRLWRLLEAACGHEALAQIRAWLDIYIPHDRRVVPDGGVAR